MPKLCPKLILEGTRLCHKTDTAFALNEHERIVGARKYRYHSPVVSAEWGTFDNTPWGRGMINFEPKDEAWALAAYEAWMRLFELHPYSSWIVDRFHISTVSHQTGVHGIAPDFAALEARLKRQGFRLVLLHRSDESFERAREERLKISGNPGQYDDLTPFMNEQSRLRELCRSSSRELLEVDISDDDVAGVADRIADWLETTGGLHQPDGLEQYALPE